MTVEIPTATKDLEQYALLFALAEMRSRGSVDEALDALLRHVRFHGGMAAEPARQLVQRVRAWFFDASAALADPIAAAGADAPADLRLTGSGA